VKNKKRKFEVIYEDVNGVISRDFHTLGDLNLPPCPPWLALWETKDGKVVLYVISPRLLKLYRRVLKPDVDLPDAVLEKIVD
jgi:hypothetical protein